jgi:hypothetical protein
MRKLRSRIIRKAPNQRLADLNEGLPEDHGLNQDLVIPFMEAKGAYHIIAKILELKYIGKGLFIHEETKRKYILTKYGFKLNTDYNYQVKYAEIIHTLRTLRQEKDAIKKNLDNLKEQREKELANFREKKHYQAITLKAYNEKLKAQKDIINLQKQKIVELRRQLNGGL